MRKLGTALHVTRRGFIIVKVDKTPPIGGRVVDKKAQRVGTIQDVFGPVKTPYVSIRPNNKDTASKLIGQPLYLYQRRN